jgi:hypothetical protein
MPRARLVSACPGSCLRCLDVIAGDEDIRQDRRSAGAWVHSRCLRAEITNISGTIFARSPTWCQTCGRPILMGSKIAKSRTHDAWAHHHCARKPLFPAGPSISPMHTCVIVYKFPGKCSVCYEALVPDQDRIINRWSGAGWVHYPACDRGFKADRSCPETLAVLLSSDSII